MYKSIGFQKFYGRNKKKLRATFSVFLSLLLLLTSPGLIPLYGVVAAYTQDKTPPNVYIEKPLDESVVSGLINLEVAVWDYYDIKKVEFYVDENLIGTSHTKPYSYKLDTTQLNEGPNVITAKAFDLAGNMGSSNEVTIHVGSTVTINNPVRVKQTDILEITAEFSANVAVTQANFYVNGVRLQEVNVDGKNTATFQWDSSNVVKPSYHLIWVEAISKEYSLITFAEKTYHLKNGDISDGESKLTATSAPIISDVTVSSITITSAQISWETDKLSNTQIEYGKTPDYELGTITVEELVTSHVYTLENLEPGTIYILFPGKVYR